MDTQRSSYQYDSFEDQAQLQELERLYRQASTLLETERALWPNLKISTGQTVLDVGCGSGVVTRELAKQVYPAQVTGVDISQALIDKGAHAHTLRQASAQTQHLQTNVNFQQGNIHQLPFPTGSFDIVYARFLFQHLNSPLEALKEVLRVLKPNGFVCILDVDKDWSSIYPEPESPVALDDEIAEKQISLGGDPRIGRKLSPYLKLAGFENVRTSIELVDSNRLGLAKFLSMLSFGDSYQSKDSKFTQLKEAVQPKLQALLDNPSTWAGFGLFVATGSKRAV